MLGIKKNPSFCVDFKNTYLPNEPEKVLPGKTIFSDLDFCNFEFVFGNNFF
jgi:hypothetical protein